MVGAYQTRATGTAPPLPPLGGPNVASPHAQHAGAGRAYVFAEGEGGERWGGARSAAEGVCSSEGRRPGAPGGRGHGRGREGRREGGGGGGRGGASMRVPRHGVCVWGGGAHPTTPGASLGGGSGPGGGAPVARPAAGPSGGGEVRTQAEARPRADSAQPQAAQGGAGGGCPAAWWAAWGGRSRGRGRRPAHMAETRLGCMHNATTPMSARLPNGVLHYNQAMWP